MSVRRSGLTRRNALALGVGAGVALVIKPALAQEEERHGISAFGDLKYPPDFKHFDFVNPQAPKGGLFSQLGATRQFNQNFLTFNSLNSFIFRGDAALGMELTFATLMSPSAIFSVSRDEPDAMYGLAAKSVQISPDRLVYRFTMRPEAKFHDGTKLTAHDAAFSLTALKTKGHPLILVQLRDMVSAEAVDDAKILLTFYNFIYI